MYFEKVILLIHKTKDFVSFFTLSSQKDVNQLVGFLSGSDSNTLNDNINKKIEKSTVYREAKEEGRFEDETIQLEGNSAETLDLPESTDSIKRHINISWRVTSEKLLPIVRSSFYGSQKKGLLFTIYVLVGSYYHFKELVCNRMWVRWKEMYKK